MALRRSSLRVVFLVPLLALSFVGVSRSADAATGPGVPYPRVSISADNSNYEGTVNNNSVYFTVTFNQIVDGFGPEDVNFWGDANPQSVETSGSGAVYHVRISGMNATGYVYAQIRARAVTNRFAFGLPNLFPSNTASTYYYYNVCSQSTAAPGVASTSC